jgi:hypothetical protein
MIPKWLMQVAEIVGKRKQVMGIREILVAPMRHMSATAHGILVQTLRPSLQKAVMSCRDLRRIQRWLLIQKGW